MVSFKKCLFLICFFSSDAVTLRRVAMVEWLNSWFVSSWNAEQGVQNLNPGLPGPLRFWRLCKPYFHIIYHFTTLSYLLNYLSVHILPSINAMLGFIFMISFELRGRRIKRNFQNENFLSTLGFEHEALLLPYYKQVIITVCLLR